MGLAAPDLNLWLGSALRFLACADLLWAGVIEALLEEDTHFGVLFCPG